MLYFSVVWWLFGWSVDLIWKVYISVVRQLGDCSANLTLEEEGIFSVAYLLASSSVNLGTGKVYISVALRLGGLTVTDKKLS